MERAKSDLEEHQLVCDSVAKVAQSGPKTAMAANNKTAGQ
jgi:hypothetical protein